MLSILLVLQLFVPFSSIFANTSAGTSQEDSDGRIKVESIDQDQESIKWRVTVNGSSHENDGIGTKISFSPGLSHGIITEIENAEIDYTPEGYEVTTPAGSDSYEFELVTGISDPSQTAYELQAKAEYSDGKFESSDQTEVMQMQEEPEAELDPEPEAEPEPEVEEPTERVWTPSGNDGDRSNDETSEISDEPAEKDSEEQVDEEISNDNEEPDVPKAVAGERDGEDIKVDVEDTVKLSYRATGLIKDQKVKFTWSYLDSEDTWQTLQESKEQKVPKDGELTDEYLLSSEMLQILLDNDSVTFKVELFNTATNEPLGEKSITLNKEDIEKQLKIKELTAILFPEPKKVHPDLLYYENVARDDRVPFSDADELWDRLIEQYNDGGIEAAQAFFDKYKWDLHHPAKKAGVPGDYGDSALKWPKNKDTPFHDQFDNSQQTIHDLEKSWINYEDFFKDENIKKNVTPYSCPTDPETIEDRKYKVEVAAQSEPAAQPVVMLFQIQQNWQIFDLLHANDPSDLSPMGQGIKTTEMANLYDIKQAMMRFGEYVETAEKVKDVPVVFGVTVTKHGGSNSFLGDGKTDPRLTNDMDIFINAIQHWDTFGYCEKVHYDNNKIQEAIAAIPTELGNWKDGLGETIDVNNVRKSIVAIGGPVRKADLEDKLHQDEDKNGNPGKLYIDAHYGIRTNKVEGVTEKNKQYVSWLESDHNQDLFEKSGAYYPDSSTEEEVLNALKDILDKEIEASKQSNAVQSDAKVENVLLEDVVEKEFDVIKDSIKILKVKGDKQETVQIDPDRLSIIENKDGTTTVRYVFDEVSANETAKIVFDIEAKDDYIGSNDVKSNVGVPTLEFEGKDNVKHERKSADKPQIHVPIQFDVKDGETIRVDENEEVNLKDLSAEIVKDIEEKITKYPQINGKVVYQWQQKGEDDEFADVGDPQTFEVTNGATDKHFDLDHHFSTDKKGKHTFRLKVSFIPNQPEDEECKAVELVKYGEVNVIVGDDYIEPGDVLLDKVGTPTDKYAEWEVELTVKGKDLKTTSDIVLVLDISSSMSNHKRFENMLKAAENLVETVMNDNPNVRIGLVEFDKEPNERLGFSNDKETVINSIKTMKMGSGTNIQGGIYYGRKLLDESEADQKTIVLLSDGSPNRSYKAEKATSYSWPENKYDFTLSDFDYTKHSSSQDYKVDGFSVKNHVIGTISEAKIAIDSGYDMYSIGLEVSSSSNAVYTIENSQNKGYYPAESDELEAVFEEIAQQLSNKGITNAIVTDPIGEMFNLVKDGSYNGENFEASHGTVHWDEATETFTWDIGDIKEDEDYFFKYKVTIDWDKNPEENVKYPMNGDTPLNYKDHNGEDKEKPFPIPEGEIELGSLTVKKVDENGESLAGATFELRDSKNNLVTKFTQIDDATIKYENLKPGNYTLVETKSPEGYRLLTKPIDIEISRSNLHVTKDVKNSKSGWELPTSGGIGTLLFYIVGIALMASTLFFLLRKKKKEE